MAVARQIAPRSLCSRDAVGAVIVDAQQKIVATGYNNPPAGYMHNDRECAFWCERAMTNGTDREYNDCLSLHAEANAIMACDRSEREGGTIYVTSSVCFNCAKLIANSGILWVVVPALQEHDMHRNPNKSYDFLLQCGLGVIYVA